MKLYSSRERGRVTLGSKMVLKAKKKGKAWTQPCNFPGAERVFTVKIPPSSAEFLTPFSHLTPYSRF